MCTLVQFAKSKVIAKGCPAEKVNFSVCIFFLYLVLKNCNIRQKADQNSKVNEIPLSKTL